MVGSLGVPISSVNTVPIIDETSTVTWLGSFSTVGCRSICLHSFQCRDLFSIDLFVFPTEHL